MVLDAGSRLWVARRDLHQVRIAPDPDAPAARPLAGGEVRLAVEHFALTANNITYAAFGETMHYWQFFPCEDAAWGCVPVWGYATVLESCHPEIEAGRRVYGYLPMGTHLVVAPAEVGAASFVDATAHRQGLPATYNQLLFVKADTREREAMQALLRPLLSTGFLIDDFLADNAFFGAGQLLLSSASSKTAYSTAFCLARRTVRPRLLGLTSAANLAFTRTLGVYDQVLAYDDVGTVDGATAAVYVDFAGDAGLRRQVHERLAGNLAYSCSIGGTHWDALGSGGGLPGPRPVLFFAPAQIQKRRAPPPEGWGAGGLQQRVSEAWRAFATRVADPAAPWLQLRWERGADAAEAAYRRLLDGRADPREGVMLSL